MPTFDLLSRMLACVHDAYNDNANEDDADAIKDGAREAFKKARGLFEKKVTCPPYLRPF